MNIDVPFVSMSPTIGLVAKSLVQAQAVLTNAIKQKEGYNFKYADLPQILDNIKNAISPQDLTFLQMVGPIREEKISLLSLLLHSSGEFISSVGEIYIDEKMKSKTQGVGSAITYLRRKAALSFFSIAEEDQVDSTKNVDSDKNQVYYIKNNGIEAHKKGSLVKNENENEKISEGTLLVLDSLIYNCKEKQKISDLILNKHNIGNLEQLTEEDAKKWITYLEKKYYKTVE